MNVEKGFKTTEFWLAAIGSLAAVIFPLLVAYKVIDSEMAELWRALILGIAAFVVPIVLSNVSKNYTDNRTAVKLEALTLEREAVALESARLEAMR